MSTPSLGTRSRASKEREVPVPVPTQTTSKVVLGEHHLSSDSRRLNCLIEGEPPIFTVTVPNGSGIHDLKKFIHESGINSAECAILAKDLQLLKVSSVPHSSVNVAAHFSVLY
jgi:hypothetical protein